MIKLCMIGSRGHYFYVFENPAVFSCVDITGISAGCSDSVEPLQNKCNAAGLSPKIYADWKEMLTKESPDLVCIDGPFESHAEMCAEALERGIHVFAEKPLALNLQDLEKIKQALSHSSARLAAMTEMRFTPQFETACSLAKNGTLGDIRTVHIQKCYRLGNRLEFYKKRSSYGGTIPWIGTHAMDLIFACGCKEFSRISAWHTTAGNNQHGDMENAAMILMTGKQDLAASISLEYLFPAGTDRFADDRMRIAGTEAVAEVRDGKVFLTDHTGTHEIPLKEQTRWIFSSFVESLTNGEEFHPTAEESLLGTELSLRARDAADQKKEIILS